MPEHNDITDLKVSLAGLSSLLSTVAETVKRVEVRMDNYTTTREYEQSKESIDDRITKLEKAQERAAWAIVLSWITAVGAVVFRKTGLIP